MHPLGYFFEDIYRRHWGIPPFERDRNRLEEAPVRPRIHPLQRFGWLPRS